MLQTTSYLAFNWARSQAASPVVQNGVTCRTSNAWLEFINSFLANHCWLAIHSWLEFIIGSYSAADGELQWGKPDCRCGGEGPVGQPLIYDGHYTQQHRRHCREHLWHTFSGRQLAGWSVYQYLLWVVLRSESTIETTLLVGSLLKCASTRAYCEMHFGAVTPLRNYFLVDSLLTC